ncbi:MAG: hypothetical protein ACK4UR_02400 [Caldimicrobium sp.]
MKKMFLIILILFFPLVALAKDIDFGLSISDGKIQSFYFSLSNFYRIPEERIIIIKKRYPIIIEEELPIVLFIVREAGIAPDVIIDLRKRGYSWYDILIRFKLYPEVVFKRYIIYGPPYGKAWGYHKHHKRKYILSDYDIISLANIKFLSEYYSIDPEVIIKYKERTPKYIDVYYEIYKEKKKKEKFDEIPLEFRKLEDSKDERSKGNGKFKKEKSDLY